MAQMRQPKIHVSNYKLARKSSVAAILHKLKPYINARCAEYFAEEAEENEAYLGGALLLNQVEKREPLIAGTIDPVKNLWQVRNVQGSWPPGLGMLGEQIAKDTMLGDNHDDDADNQNQGRAQSSNAAAGEEFKKLYPIWYKIGRLQTANLNDRIQHLFITTKFKLPLPQCAVIRPPPRRGRRMEIDLAAFEKIFNHSLSVITLNTIITLSPKPKSTPALIEKPEPTWLEKLAGADNVCFNMLHSIIEAPMKLKPQLHSWLSTNEEFIKVLTYLVVICILGFVFTLLI
ncbi:hypothetical protein KR093_011564 [Drosophila rubida]|uniref:Uncharacterized protein n=1 Tax=Drosophila rubida TaxID=30044 RepID=A0AAD4KFP3_9MUSC|nr:hypothetical protein KR093_011564 [Drosophila rubida]